MNYEKDKMKISDDLEELLEVLPPNIRKKLEKQEDLSDLIEVVVDLGRYPEARFPKKFVFLSLDCSTWEDIQYITSRTSVFSKDNRAGIERTLHRISAIRNRSGEIIGLTLRVGRAVYGTIDIIRDIIEKGENILLLGKPGVGKTTLLRETARVLSDDLFKRVIVVDTSNEIAGDGDVPHPGIGNSRRMQVAEPSLQHSVMIEAVENHMPEVIIVDEIGTEQEAYAARTIAERGVQLIATAHGNSLENLLVNPTLLDLIGGISSVTLSDEEAKKRGTQKTVLERKAPPTFDTVIEILDKNTLAAQENVREVVDLMLRGQSPLPEVRLREAGAVRVIQESNLEELSPQSSLSNNKEGFQQTGEKLPVKVLRIFPMAISKNRLERAINILKLPAQIVRHWDRADIILTLKNFEKRESKRIKFFSERMPVHILKSNTTRHIQEFLKEYFQK